MHAPPIPIYRQRLQLLAELQKLTSHQPYSIVHRLRLARAYNDLGYPDLAASDAYKALSLIDEVNNDGEFHEQATLAAEWDLRLSHAYSMTDDCNDEKKLLKQVNQDWRRETYEILISCLLDCDCLRSAFLYNKQALNHFSEITTFDEFNSLILERLGAHFSSANRDFDTTEIQDYPDKGSVRREIYPWNNYESDRSIPDTLGLLNQELAHVAPKLEVRVTELPQLGKGCAQDKDVKVVKQLGLFAKEDIAPGEKILEERSLLTAISRHLDMYCDACSVKLPSNSEDGSVLICEECEEVFYCSQQCHDLAQENYHPSLCGVDVHNEVRASEAADALYNLLLIRAIALAETQRLHPLELNEVRHIWGDFHTINAEQLMGTNEDKCTTVPRTLPFSFQINVLHTLNILEKMEINIFENDRYDVWVFNTLLAKFRGTASAQQGLDGRPEIGAVHPIWCLANHSCDPNVAWEWQGNMRFWARRDPILWKGLGAHRTPGLKKGKEVMSHYCDITLPMKERREWAVGALGGYCLCDRCCWEDTLEQQSALTVHS